MPKLSVNVNKVALLRNARGRNFPSVLDYDAIGLAHDLGADRVELYTEPYAEAFGTGSERSILDGFAAAAKRAQVAGLGVNAGHDLNLENLGRFVQIVDILEVSVGHALTVERIEHGVAHVIGRYLQILSHCHAPAPWRRGNVPPV